VSYRDLAEFGLPLIPAEAPNAVLTNQSGKAIVALAFIWQYTMPDGKTRNNRYSNLGSSMQLDVLCGRAKVAQDFSSFILPGAKRLITEHGIFGNNLDVLPADYNGHLGCGGFGGGGYHKDLNEQIAGIELTLDIAILEDGLCVGPDESGLFERISNDLDRQCEATRLILTALRSDASDGTIFEILRPLARRTPPFGANVKTSSPLLSLFANMAIDRLVEADRPELLAWFEPIAESTPSRLHRPSHQTN
jgi:hypothetical protein